jgi:hypothetical protein
MRENPLSKFVVSAIEEWSRKLEHLGEALYRGESRGMLPPLVLIDPGTCRKFVNTCLDPQL